MTQKNISIPQEVTTLPLLAQMAWINAFNSSIDSGNTEETSFRVAWATVRSGFKQDKAGAWKQKDEDENLLAGINSAVDYSGINIDSEGCIEIHLASVGADPDITTEAVNNWITNFESNARGQYIPLVVDHPFFKEFPTDTKARGWIKTIYRKGDSDVFAKVKLTPLGVKTITDQEYLYISPGWFPKYQHVLFGNDVKDVLFEVSLTNTPAQKMLQPITELIESSELKEDSESMDLDKNLDKLKVFGQSEGIPDESEDLNSLFETLSGCAKKITNHPNMKNKTGNAGLRAKFKDIMSQLSAKLQDEQAPDNQGLFLLKSMYGLDSPEEKRKWLLQDLIHAVSAITEVYPDDPKMDILKNHLKLFISDLTMQLDEDNSSKIIKEDIDMSDTPKQVSTTTTMTPTTITTAETKTSEEVIQLRESLRITEEKLKAVEAEKTRSEIKAKVESWLPKESPDGKIITSKIKSESVGRVSTFMESLTSEQRKEFSEIMDLAVPEKGMLAGEIGHGGYPDEKEDMPESPKAKEEARYKAEMAAFEIAKKARPEEQQAVFLAELSKLDPEA